MNKTSLGILAAVFVMGMSLSTQARTPSAKKVNTDVTRYWKKKWPDQQMAHAERKSEKCEPAKLEIKGRRGKTRKIKACLLKADVFVERGYRYFIYRGTDVYYKGNRLVSVQLGELQKAWKEGGVPAPSQDEALNMIKAQAVQKFGKDSTVSMVETGVPRPFKDVYRITYVVNVTFTKDGKEQKLERKFATLESDGTEWKAVPSLMF